MACNLTCDLTGGLWPVTCDLTCDLHFSPAVLTDTHLWTLILVLFKFPDVESRSRQTSVDPDFITEKSKSWPGSKFAGNFVLANTAAKRLRMRQVEHFRSLFPSHFPVRSIGQIKVSRALSASFCVPVCSLWFSCSASCCSCF